MLDLQLRSPTSYGVSSLATAMLIFDSHLSPSNSNWTDWHSAAEAGFRPHGATPSKFAEIYIEMERNEYGRGEGRKHD